MKAIYWLGGIIIVASCLLQGVVSYRSVNPITSLGGRSYETPKTLLSAVATTTWSTPIRVDDYRNVVLMLSTASATTTVQVACSNDNVSDNYPTFSSAASATNFWDYVQTVDMEDGTSYDGDTGYSFTGTSDNRQIEVNTELCTWLAVKNTRTTGTTTVKVKYGTNQ